MVPRSGGGLCAPLPIDTDAAAAAADRANPDDPVAAALRRAPAVVMAGPYTRPRFGSSYARIEAYAGWRLYFSDKENGSDEL